MRHVPHALLIAGLFLVGCSTAQPAATETEAAHEIRKPADVERETPLLNGLNVHSHPVSTPVPEAQQFFDQGLVLAFGFNHAEAARSFRQAQKYDPKCAMCYWGEAIVLGPNYNAPMPDENVPVAWEAIQRARELAEQYATPRERAYINALAERYAPEPREDRSDLDQAYAEAMGEVAEQYSDDYDAAALHAEALMNVHPWDLWTRDGEPKPWTPEILEVLEGVLDDESNHVLANHMYIHAVEASDNPERGLEAAERLIDMVPGAGHLVHMPSHIFIRTGDYHRASKANERAVKVDEAYLEQVETQGDYPLGYYPHNYHFLWATTALEGRSEDSLAAAQHTRSAVDTDMMREPGLETLQHYYSIPYYAQVTFGKWETILEEPKPADDLPYPTGAWHWARGMAELRTGHPDAAGTHLEEVATLAEDERVEKVTIWDINETSALLEIGADILRGEIAADDGDYDTAIEHLRRAVENEDALNYDEPPPWGQAARRYLGAILLEADRPADAERAYREDLDEFPDNGWSLYGLAESLDAQGETEKARQVRERFDHAWRHADVELTASRF